MQEQSSSFVGVMGKRTQAVLLCACALGAALVVKPYVDFKASPALLVGVAACLLHERLTSSGTPAADGADLPQINADGDVVNRGARARGSEARPDGSRAPDQSGKAWTFSMPKSSVDIVEEASANGELARAREAFAPRGQIRRRGGASQAPLPARAEEAETGAHDAHADAGSSTSRRVYAGRTKRGKPRKTIKSVQDLSRAT